MPSPSSVRDRRSRGRRACGRRSRGRDRGRGHRNRDGPGHGRGPGHLFTERHEGKYTRCTQSISSDSINLFLK